MTTIEEGDLIAYIEGESLEHVEQALRESPALRTELERLRALHSTFHRTFGGVAQPDPQDLVDVATGQATPQQQLRVAAYVRESPTGFARLELLQRTYAEATTPKPQRRVSFPRIVAHVLSAAGTRSSETGSIDQAFSATALRAQVTLRRVPPERERYKVQGHVLQDNEPVSTARVVLRRTGKRARIQMTDSMGFFAFENLLEGTYQLEVTLTQGLLIIPELTLHDD